MKRIQSLLKLWEMSRDIHGVVMCSRVEPLVGYCAMLDFCNRLNSVGTNDDKVLEREL